MIMSYSESEKISAVLNFFIYKINEKGAFKGAKISKLISNEVINSDMDILGMLIKNNPEIGKLTLVDYSWTSGEYGISENPGGLYAATFVSPVRRRP